MSDDESTRPWGRYDILSEADDFKTKTITVLPGKRLSYQRHQHRAEHWFVVKGSGSVTLDGVDKALTAGDSVDIPVGAAHRMSNSGAEELGFV